MHCSAHFVAASDSMMPYQAMTLQAAFVHKDSYLVKLILDGCLSDATFILAQLSRNQTQDRGTSKAAKDTPMLPSKISEGISGDRK